MKVKKVQELESEEEDHFKKKPKKQSFKKLASLEKLSESVKDNNMTSFLQHMAESIKEFEKLDPSLKPIIRSILSNDDAIDSEPESRFNSSSRAKKLLMSDKANQKTAPRQTAASRHRASSVIKESIEEDSGSAKKNANNTIAPNASLTSNRSTILKKSNSQLDLSTQHTINPYDFTVGYCCKFTQVKELSLIKEYKMQLIRADNLNSVQQGKIRCLVTDDEHLKSNICYLYCILYNIPILKLAWVNNSVKKGKPQEFEEYRINPTLNLSILKNENIMVYKDKLNKKPILDQETDLLNHAIEKFGGTVQNSITRADVLVILDSQIDKIASSSHLRKEIESSLAKTVNKKWLVDCILEASLKNHSNPLYEVRLKG